MESMTYFGYWMMQVAAMMLTVLLIPRLRLTGISGILLMVAAIAAVNAYLWDAQLFFAIPDNFSSRALLLVLSNGIIFWVLAKILPGIEIDGVLPAIAAPVVFTACAMLVRSYGSEVDWVEAAKTGGNWIVETMGSLRNYFEQ